MAYQAISSKITTTTQSHTRKCSGGGDVVIARGSSIPSSNHLQNYIQKNPNKTASSRYNKAHSLNSFSQGKRTESKFAFGTGNVDMAGDIHVMDSKKPRRQWTLRDQSVMSVHLLKENLAEDGCEEAQLDIAKKLLQDCKDNMESSQSENSRLAIYWLIKSSEQGNNEATRLLKECQKSGRGITGQNILDVKTCITTPKNEKLAFKAARLLYLKLNNGEEFITTTQIKTHIHLTKKDVDIKISDSTADSTESSTHSSFTENTNEVKPSELAFFESHRMNETFTYPHSNSQKTKSATSLNHGQGGNDTNEDILSEKIGRLSSSEEEEMENQEGVKLTLEELLKVGRSFNSGKNPYPPIDSRNREFDKHKWKFSCQLNAFVGQLLILSTLIGVIDWKDCCLYALGFFSTWASFNLLLWRNRHSNFNDWSEALKSVLSENNNWSEDYAENRLTLSLLLPYLLTIICSLVLFSVLDGLDLFKLVIGGLVMFCLFRGVMKNKMPNWRIILIFSIARAPNLIIMVVKNIETFFQREMIQHDAFVWLNDFHKEISQQLLLIPDMSTVILTLQIVLILSLLWTTTRNNLLQKSFPEILFAFWFLKIFQISMEFSVKEFSTCCVACIFLVLVLLIFESRMEVWKTILILFGIFLIASSVASSICTLNEGSFETCVEKLKSSSSSAMAVTQTLPYLHMDINKLNEVEWEEYNINCHRKAWKTVSPAATQVSCFLKYGIPFPTSVRWKGQISVVKVREMTQSSMKNSIEDISFDLNINILTVKASDSSWQNYLPGSENEHSAPATILVSTKHYSNPKDKQNLIDHVLNFRSGDRVEFHGILNPSSVGGLKPEIINVQQLTCLNCALIENYVDLIVVSQLRNEKVDQMQEQFAESSSENYLNLLRYYIQLLKSKFIFPEANSDN